MRRLQQLFNEKKSNILSVYCTAGYPELENTTTIIEALDKAGADLIEIGIPFSDPMADGPTIQESNLIALQNGMTLTVLFAQLKQVRATTQIPLLLMGYLNPIIQYGFDRFCKDCNTCGIDALIIPDIPLPEYEKTYKSILDRHGIGLIFLISPQTPPERILKIDALSESFIYLVTSTATTGKNLGFDPHQLDYLNRIKKMKLKHPVLAGFGIRTAQDFNTISSFVEGGIIGSGFIEALTQADSPLESAISAFVNNIRQPAAI